jgi:hypothetical protein
MKTKQILVIVSTTIAITLLLSSFKKEEINKKFLTVKSVESVDPLFTSLILIVDENGKASDVELKKFKIQNMEENVIILTDVLNKIGSRGYDLHSTTSTFVTHYHVNTYTFIKK